MTARPVTTEAAAGARRARILAHLARHPDLTAHELARLIGTASTVTNLLRDMQLKGPGDCPDRMAAAAGPPGAPVAACATGDNPAAPVTGSRGDRGAAAASGIAAPTAARRARMRAPVPQPAAIPLPGAACRTANPALFFPDPGDTDAEAQALAVCAGCPVRAQCYARAVDNGERWGIWGGVNFGMTAVSRGAGPGQEPEAG